MPKASKANKGKKDFGILPMPTYHSTVVFIGNPPASLEACARQAYNHG